MTITPVRFEPVTDEEAEPPPEDLVAVLRRAYVPFISPGEADEDWVAAIRNLPAAELEARLARYAAR